MTTEAPKHQLDHATARIVTELAAVLLPHLKETVSAELTKAIESLPGNIDREVEESLSSLRRFRALFEDMKEPLNSAQTSALLISSKLLPLSCACETLSAATERLEQLTAKPDANGAAQINEELLRSLEANLADWGGILKANGHAQTKELSEFSAEVSEQVGWMKYSMPQAVGEVFEKTLSSRTEECRASGESVRALEAKVARLEKIGKIILAEGIVLIALAAIAAALCFKVL